MGILPGACGCPAVGDSYASVRRIRESAADDGPSDPRPRILRLPGRDSVPFSCRAKVAREGYSSAFCRRGHQPAQVGDYAPMSVCRWMRCARAGRRALAPGLAAVVEDVLLGGGIDIWDRAGRLWTSGTSPVPKPEHLKARLLIMATRIARYRKVSQGIARYRKVSQGIARYRKVSQCRLPFWQRHLWFPAVVVTVRQPPLIPRLPSRSSRLLN